MQKSVTKNFYVEYELWDVVSKATHGSIKSILLLSFIILFALFFVSAWFIAGLFIADSNILIALLMFAAGIYSTFFILNQFRISYKRVKG